MVKPVKPCENDVKMCDEGLLERCVCVKGLPSRATSQDLLDFFSGFKIQKSDIHLIFKSRRCFGKAFLNFQSSMDARLACSKDHDFFNPDKFGPRYVRVLPATFLEMEELHSKLSANKIDTKRDQDDLLAGNEGKVRATSHGGATHALFLQRTKGKVQKVKKQINKSPSIPPFTFSEQLCPTRLCTTTAMNPVWHGNLVPGLPNQCHLDSGTLHYPINDTTSMRYVVHDLYTGSKVYLQSLTLDTGANNQLPALSEYDGEGSLTNALFQDLFNETCGATMDPSVDLTISETWIDTETQMNM